MIASYYLWKWAENDLPGKPNEVFAELVTGKMPPSLQAFNAKPILRRIEQLAQQDRVHGKDWDWQIQKEDGTEQARFVYVTGPAERFDVFAAAPIGETVYRWGLSAYEEQIGRLAYGRPKLFCFEFETAPWVYDFSEEDLPLLLRKIDNRRGNSTGVIVNSRQDFLGICNHEGVYHDVEWRTWMRQVEGPFTQWRAESKRKSAKVIPLGGLSFSETLKIVQAFYRAESRPANCHWRNISLEARSDQKEIRKELP